MSLQERESRKNGSAERIPAEDGLSVPEHQAQTLGTWKGDAICPWSALMCYIPYVGSNFKFAV